MSALRISAYLQHHPGAPAWRVARELGVSTRTVYRHKIIVKDPLPTWEVSEMALRVWLALGDVGTISGLTHDLGVKSSTVYRGLRELRDVGLVTSFRSKSTGKTIYRREERVRDPFDVFGSEEQEVAEFDPFLKKKDQPRTDSVADTAFVFAQWVEYNFPKTPYQTNRKALMSALGKARKEHGITPYQEKMALQVWFSKSPRPKGQAPLWRQFLAAYPALVMDIPSAPPAQVTRTPEDDDARQERKRQQALYEETLEMARTLDRSLKDKDYDEWLSREGRGALYVQRVSRGAVFADPWEPPRSAPTDDLGPGGVVVDDGLDGQADEGSSDTAQYFVDEDAPLYYVEESDADADAGV